MPDLVFLLLVLVPVGVGVGLTGSLIGVGGGFFVVPFLLFFGGALFGEGFTPETATAASLGTVFLSAVSATVGNARRKRIDYRTGAAMAAGTLPGAWLGRLLVAGIEDRTFALAFAGLLGATALYIAFVKLKAGRGLVRGTPREITDSDGQTHAYEANLFAGFAAALGIGVIATLFGVGGGLVMVPFLVIVFGTSTIVATSTAQFIFIFTSAAGLGVAVFQGQMASQGWTTIATMGPGVVVGAQIGVAIAKRIRPRLIRLMIAAVLMSVATLMILR